MLCWVAFREHEALKRIMKRGRIAANVPKGWKVVYAEKGRAGRAQPGGAGAAVRHKDATMRRVWAPYGNQTHAVTLS